MYHYACSTGKKCSPDFLGILKRSLRNLLESLKVMFSVMIGVLGYDKKCLDTIKTNLCHSLLMASYRCVVSCRYTLKTRCIELVGINHLEAVAQIPYIHLFMIHILLPVTRKHFFRIF